VAAVDAYQQAMASVARAEQGFWAAYPDRATRAMASWRAGDPRPLREIYDRYAALMAKRGWLDRQLAGSAKGAFQLLFPELLAVASAIDGLDARLLDVQSRDWARVPGQADSIRRHALAVRRTALVAALAYTPDAPAEIAGVWDRAVQLDRARSVVRRVALLDALGRTREPAALVILLGHLKAPSPSVRIAALENAAVFGERARIDLEPLLADSDGAVRRALLRQVVGYDHAHAAAWAPAITRAAASVPEVGRPALLEALTAMLLREGARRQEVADQLTSMDHGDLMALLSFRSKVTRLGGIHTQSAALWFLLDGRLGDQAMRTSVGDALTALPSHARFGIDLLHTGETGTFGPYPALPIHVHGARLFLARTHPTRVRRASLLRSLLRALERGMDTVILVGDGSISAGPFLVREAALGAFERKNRFHRVTVHTILPSAATGSDEALLKTLADRSGGRFVRLP